MRQSLQSGGDRCLSLLKRVDIDFADRETVLGYIHLDGIGLRTAAFIDLSASGQMCHQVDQARPANTGGGPSSNRFVPPSPVGRMDQAMDSTLFSGHAATNADTFESRTAGRRSYPQLAAIPQSHLRVGAKIDQGGGRWAIDHLGVNNSQN